MGGRIAEEIYHEPDDDRRGQRHRARHGAGAQDGLRVGHERAGAADLRQEGRADLPGPRDRAAPRLLRRDGHGRSTARCAAWWTRATSRRTASWTRTTRRHAPAWRRLCWSARRWMRTRSRCSSKGNELPPLNPPSNGSASGDPEVKVLKPEPGRAPGFPEGSPSPA